MNRNLALTAFAVLLIAGLSACGGSGSSSSGSTGVTPPPSTFQVTFTDPNGTFTTFTKDTIDVSNPFFTKLGANDRTCASCHDAGDGWSITPPHLQQRFQASQTDPVFRPLDGANCPSADVSTSDARALAYSLLLKKGLIRMTLAMPANSEFSIIAINDPYACPETTASQPALYRRPLPSTNLKFLTGIMWDGREPDLASQALSAITVHAEPTSAPTDAQLQQIVSLENTLFTAQTQDSVAGDLTAQGANGGALFLSTQTFSPGINSGSGFDPNAFSLFTNWASVSGTHAAAQQSIARGEVLFNTFPMRIFNVPGFNDVLGQTQVIGTCTTCHNAPNVGSGTDPSFAMLNIGTTSPSLDLPSYTVLCTDSTQLVTTDPGRAMITGKCADIGKFKTPGMRGLAARAPYFHNGSAATLMDVVNFYDQRFGMLLTDDEKADLVAFMSAL